MSHAAEPSTGTDRGSRRFLHPGNQGGWCWKWNTWFAAKRLQSLPLAVLGIQGLVDKRSISGYPCPDSTNYLRAVAQGFWILMTPEDQGGPGEQRKGRWFSIYLPVSRSSSEWQGCDACLSHIAPEIDSRPCSGGGCWLVHSFPLLGEDTAGLYQRPDACSALKTVVHQAKNMCVIFPASSASVG